MACMVNFCERAGETKDKRCFFAVSELGGQQWMHVLGAAPSSRDWSRQSFPLVADAWLGWPQSRAGGLCCSSVSCHRCWWRAPSGCATFTVYMMMFDERLGCAHVRTTLYLQFMVNIFLSTRNVCKFFFFWIIICMCWLFTIAKQAVYLEL